MDARELRIGNYLMEGKVLSINLGSVVTYKPGDMYTTLHPEEFSPIPLSEEWLFKFGFEKADFYGNFKVKAGDYYHSVKYYDGECVYSNDYSDADCYAVASIHYVHQLQNIYYSLTSEELTIKND